MWSCLLAMLKPDRIRSGRPPADRRYARRPGEGGADVTAGDVNRVTAHPASRGAPDPNG